MMSATPDRRASRSCERFWNGSPARVSAWPSGPACASVRIYLDERPEARDDVFVAVHAALATATKSKRTVAGTRRTA